MPADTSVWAVDEVCQLLGNNGSQPCKISTLRRKLLETVATGQESAGDASAKAAKLLAADAGNAWLWAQLIARPDLVGVSDKGRVTLALQLGSNGQQQQSASTVAVAPVLEEAKLAPTAPGSPAQLEKPKATRSRAKTNRKGKGSAAASQQEKQGVSSGPSIQLASTMALPTQSDSQDVQGVQKRRQGHHPNVQWRAVSIQQLRSHIFPCFWGLPPPAELRFSPRVPEGWRHLRQDSELWQALHRGILTSRNTPAFLGLLEPKAAKFTGAHSRTGAQRFAVEEIRRSYKWRTEQETNSRHKDRMRPCTAMADYVFAELGLQEPVNDPDSLMSFNRKACDRSVRRMVSTLGNRGDANQLKSVRNRQHLQRQRAPRDVAALRMRWGTVQEGTALAAYLGYLNAELLSSPVDCTSSLHSVLSEVGLVMLDPAEIPESCLPECSSAHAFDPSTLPPLGASPDAMLRLGSAAPKDWRDSTHQQDDPTEDDRSWGAWVPVEVKCICPWSEPYGHQTAGRLKREGKFVLNEFTPHTDRLPTHAVVQTQLEMLATRKRHCILLSYMATQGMAIVRLRRDDDYCAALLSQLARVQREYVMTGRQPGKNCGWGDPQYMDFLRRTKKLRAVASHGSASLEAVVPTPATPVTGSGGQLFLDQGVIDEQTSQVDQEWAEWEAWVDAEQADVQLLQPSMDVGACPFVPSH